MRWTLDSIATVQPLREIDSRGLQRYVNLRSVSCMATQNNVHIPDELLVQAQRMAESQGRTADELAADALKRYLAREWLNRVSSEGEGSRRRVGIHTEEEAEEYINRVIAEYRKESHDR